MRHKVLVIAATYAAVAWLLFELVERTMPVAVPRLLVTVLLAYGFPITLILAWVLTGASLRGRAKIAIIGLFCVALLIWLHNTSRFTEHDTEPYFIAHRGVHQVMNPEHDNIYECLGRIYPPEHTYIENTLPSMQAAFGYGARFVEIDIRPTTDGDFAVFHDDTLDCKTESQGRVREHTMAELKALDVGYGYFTAEGEHPLRGKGVGMMRSLNEVLDAFPTKAFIINVKFGNGRELWLRLAEYLGTRTVEDQRRIAVFGVPRGAAMLQEALPNITVSSYERALQCARSYIIVGWTGYVPAVCRRSITGTFVDTGWVFWGWSTKFLDRMERANAVVIMRPRGQTEQEFAASIPADYSGGIQTDRIEKFRDWMSSGTL